MLSTRRALRSSSCCWCRGEFGGTQPWGNCARRGLARSVITCGWRKANAKPSGKPRDFWATAGPWEGGTRCPYFIQRFVRGLQMRWQGDLWLRWPKGNASPARALPTLPTLHPNLLTGFLLGPWHVPSASPVHHSVGCLLLAQPGRAETIFHDQILQFKPQKPHENLALHHNLPA